jgi:hypothetical protein
LQGVTVSSGALIIFSEFSSGLMAGKVSAMAEETRNTAHERN